MSQSRSKLSTGARGASLPSNLPQPVRPEEYEFNSIGFYGGLLNRLDATIANTEELYKQSFYKVTSFDQQDVMNH